MKNRKRITENPKTTITAIAGAIVMVVGFFIPEVSENSSEISQHINDIILAGGGLIAVISGLFGRD
jgi:phage-related protein